MTDGFDDTTDDRFLGGKLRLRQPRTGHRAGHDAILLAAATAAVPGQVVVDFGSGVGTAGLAVARRMPGIQLRLVEIDERLASLARYNCEQNLIDAEVINLNIAAEASSFVAAGLLPDSADVILMNPPYNDAIRHRASPDKTRQLAHVATASTLVTWVHAARRTLRSGGALSLIWRADGLGDVLSALDRGFGSVTVLPVYGDPSAPAIRVIVRAVKGGRAVPAILPPVMLRNGRGQSHPYVERILAGDATLLVREVVQMV